MPGRAAGSIYQKTDTVQSPIAARFAGLAGTTMAMRGILAVRPGPTALQGRQVVAVH